MVFILLQVMVSMTGIRNGLAGANAAIFENVLQRFLPEVELQAGAVPENGEIKFSFYSRAEAERMVSEIKKSGRPGTVNVPKYDYGIDPAHHLNMALAFLIALFLATPLAWGRRFVLAGVGIVLFYLYSFFRIAIRLKYEIGKLNIGLYESDPDPFLSLHKLNNVLTSLGLIFVVIILIWALLVFSKQNIKQMKLVMSDE